MSRAFSPTALCQIESQCRLIHEIFEQHERSACVMSLSNSSCGVRAATLSRTTRSKHLCRNEAHVLTSS